MAEARKKFFDNIEKLITAHGYDGIDIDMEPMEEKDAPDFQVFIPALHAAMKAANSNAILTAAIEVSKYPSIFKPIQNEFDQLNLMTYVFAGPWDGVTWYDANLANGGKKDPKGKPLPGCDLFVKNWEGGGITPAKLGIGISFGAAVWHGATGPGQSLEGVRRRGMPYSRLMDTLYAPDAYHWDKEAQAPYLSIASPEKLFVVYDDPRACQEKIDFIHKQGLGGFIIWEITGDYRPAQPAGKQHPLMQAIVDAKP